MKYHIYIFCILVLIFSTSTHADKDMIRNMLATQWNDRSDLGYKLHLMGDEAIPFLVEQFTNENRPVREHALHCIQEYYPIPQALSALTVVFIHNEDSWMRFKAAHIMARIDGEYTKRLMVKHLHADPDTQRTVIDVLTKLKDERVVPFLVQLMEDPDTLPERRRSAIYGLADFNDKRAVPVMLEILKNPDNIDGDILERFIEKLAQIDDVRTIPVLVSVFHRNSAIGRRISKTHSEKVINALSQAGTASLQKVLEIAQMPVPENVQQSLLKVLRSAKDPALVPIYEKVCLETGSSALKSALVEGLKNMGTEGLKSLLVIVKQKPCTESLNSLASFNSVEAIEAVAKIALDDAAPLRIDAIETLTLFGSLWHEQVSKYIPELLEDPNLDVRLSTLDLIRKMKLMQMIPVLKQLTQNSKGNTRYAAYTALDYLLDKTPLELKIEMNQQRYDYGEPIALTYTIKNVSDHPIRIGYRRTLSSSYLKLKIQKPDNTLAKYQGKWDRYRLASDRQDDLTYWLAMDGENEMLLAGVKVR